MSWARAPALGSAGAAETEDVERGGWFDRIDAEWTGKRAEEEFTAARQHGGFTPWGSKTPIRHAATPPYSWIRPPSRSRR
jgi:hypothetical protein